MKSTATICRSGGGKSWRSRAYLRDAVVLVLDKPTAALDTRGEVAVYRQFRDMAQGRQHC